MAAVTFPSNPTNGDTFSVNDKTYTYNATKNLWKVNTVTITTDNITEGTANLFYSDARVQAKLGNITGNIIPDTDVVYNLGSPDKKFKDLYLSGNTIYFGNVSISSQNNRIVLPEGSQVGNVDVPTQIDQMTNVDSDIKPEVLVMNFDFPNAGHGSDWLWTWDAGLVTYGRIKNVNQVQSSIPIFKDSSYIVNNFAAHDLHGSMTQTHHIFLKWINSAGTDNLVPWVTYTESVTGVTNTNINSGIPTEVQRLSFTVPSTITEPTLVVPTVGYSVSFANAGAYTFTGVAAGDNADLGPIYRGGTYTFNLDSSITGHPFYLTTDDGTNFAANTYVGEYTTGVTGSRNDSGSVVFTVPADAPDTLYYQCGVHSSMRGEITVKDLAVEVNEFGNYVLYFQHHQEGHFTPVEIKSKPDLTSADNVCLVYKKQSGKFEIKDMGQYLDETAQFKTKITDLITTTTSDKASYTDVTQKIKDETVFTTTMYQNGNLEVLTGSIRWFAPYDLTVTGITPRLGTAADNTVGVVIKKNNVNTKTISFASTQTTATVADPVISMTTGDYLTVDVTSVGTTNVGKDLYVQFTYKKA
jgi:hypothetical protein